MIRTIVVPLDGSPGSESILPHLSRLFQAVNAEIRLVHVYDWTEAGFRRGRAYLENVTSRFAERFPGLQSDLLKGKPDFEIMKYAVVNHADLIAMTTRGSSGLRTALFGSTAQELLRHSQVPIYLARPLDPPKEIRRILVPIDGSKTSQGILPVVRDLAQGAGAHVTFLTVLPHEGEAERAQRALKRVATSFALRGVPVQTLVKPGEAVKEILDAARADGADVIALGTHGRTGSDRFFFGSVAEAVMQGAKIPLILRRTQKLPVRKLRPAPAAKSHS